MPTQQGRLTSSSARWRLDGPSVKRIASSPSVTVYWLDRELALRKLKSAVHRLARERPEVLRVLLFGSMARGDAVPGSDADLLLVLRDSKRPFLDRIPLYFPSGCDFGVDVFPYTEQELSRMAEQGNSFIYTALSEAKVLFQRNVPRTAG